MTAIVTSSEVFEYMGIASDDPQRTAHDTMLTTLIASAQLQLEAEMGRSIDTVTITNQLLEDGVDCCVLGNKIFLNGPYRDMNTITALSENGETVAALTTYADIGAYVLDTKMGCIIRNAQDWAPLSFGLKISGTYGLTLKPKLIGAVKHIIKEMAAAQSGIWKTFYSSDAGDVETVRRSISKEAKKLKDMLVFRDLV